MKKFGAASFGEKFLPARESVQRPARVHLIGAVAHADDARFAAGTCAGVRGAVGINEQHGGAGFSQAIGGPGAEDACADDGDVVRAQIPSGH